MSDYTDYQAVSWSVAKPTRTFNQATLRRLPIYVVIFGIVMFLTYRLSINQRIIAPHIIIWTFGFVAMVFLVTFNSIIYMVEKGRGPILTPYEISKDGINVGGKVVSLASLNTRQVLSAIENVADSDDMVLRVSSRLTLKFPTQNEKKSALSALQNYLQA